MKTTIINVSKNSGVIAYFFEGGVIFFAGTVNVCINALQH
jgi:hypothetical protein